MTVEEGGGHLYIQAWENPRANFYAALNGPKAVDFKANPHISVEMLTLPKRLMEEIDNARAPSMTACGIYYCPNEANMRNGRAMIIGPEDTPYANCPLVFDIACPADYPLSSPTVNFLTSDGTTRFHPNLYVAGKVCLSILGTWRGPSWTAAMSISTVLSSIQSLLEPNPIVNEPSWENVTLADERAKNYADFVKYRLTALTFRDLLAWKRGQIPTHWEMFEDILEERGEELYTKICAYILKMAESDEVEYKNITYNMSGKTEWKRMAAQVKLLPL